MDESCIKVKGQRVYLYRTVDRFGKTLDLMPSKRRSKNAADRFFARAMEANGLPERSSSTRAPPIPRASRTSTGC